MTKPTTITALDNALGNLRDQVDHFEMTIGSPSVDPSHRVTLSFHLEAILEALKVLEREVAILGMPSIDEDHLEPIPEDLEEAFGHLFDQVENLDETIGSSEVHPTQRASLALQSDAIREAVGVLERQSRKFRGNQSDSILNATMYAVQLEEAYSLTARANDKLRAGHELLCGLMTSMSEEFTTRLAEMLSVAKHTRQASAEGTLSAKDQVASWSRIEVCGEELQSLVADLLTRARAE